MRVIEPNFSEPSLQAGTVYFLNAQKLSKNSSLVREAGPDLGDALPSQTLPRRAARPIKRLLALAQALSRDQLRPRARTEATDRMCRVLDGLLARYADEVAAALADVETLSGQTLVAGVNSSSEFDVDTFVERADARAIDAEFARAARVLTRDLARIFCQRLAGAHEDEDDDLLEAQARVAALAQVDGVAADLDREADVLAQKWFGQYRVDIKALSDERRAVYDDIRSLSVEPQPVEMQRPRVRAESGVNDDGSPVERVAAHLMSDADGQFPIGSLNDWESAVVKTELARADCRAWYRNPSRASEDSLVVAYRDGADEWRRLCPDFVFFSGSERDVEVSIVDPHGHHLGDALPKLRGLARFAAQFGERLHRVEAVSRTVDGRLRVLDLTDQRVRTAVDAANDPESLYLGPSAQDYS